MILILVYFTLFAHFTAYLAIVEYLFVAFSQTYHKMYTRKNNRKWLNDHEERGSNVGRQFIIYWFRNFIDV